MDGEAGWWTTSGNIGLPPLARVMGVGRQQQHIYHFMLHCTAYNEERSHSTQLQQPYIESHNDILGHFLFNKEDIEEKKELIWKRRQHQMKII